jgi:hypothetical protein
VISQANARDYLSETLGISVPSFFLTAAMDKVEAIEAALVVAGYDEATVTMIESMATAILAAAGAPRQIKDQRAPSGASRGFDNHDDALSKLRRSLAAMDTAGVTTDLVGPDPAANSLFLVAA